MQSDVMHVQVQPFIKLAQSNMELWTRFSTSSDVTSQMTANASELLQKTSSSATKLMSSGAFAQLVQGMMQNYMDFLGEIGQGSMQMLSAGQAEFARQAQEAASAVIEAPARGRRSRQAS